MQKHSAIISLSGKRRDVGRDEESNVCETDINGHNYSTVGCSLKYDSHYVKEIVNHIKVV